MPTRIREAAATATQDGLPRKAFAYAPTANPSDWKLPIYTASGAVDADRLPGAAAAFSPGGYRGQKVDIPAEAVAAVKARIRAAYRKWKGSDAEYPDSIKESEVEIIEAEGEAVRVSIREAVVLLDKASCSAQVVSLPNGDTVVIPSWDGAFQQQAKAYSAPSGIDPWDQSYNVSDASSALAILTRLRGREITEPDQVAQLDTAINGLASYVKAEATEPVAESASEPAVLSLIAEAGKRNSKSDQNMIQAAHDVLHDLGAVHTPGKQYAGMPDDTAGAAKVSEAAVVIDPESPREQVTFAESGEAAVLVTLSEARATFDDENRVVTITPIKPGFGNKRDGFFYPEQTLREATDAGLFNHVKMFRNHPGKAEEKDRPERDVNDWFATTREANWDAVSGEPRVPVKVHDQKDYDRWKEAPEQIAFSVRGGGYARKANVGGTPAKVMESLARVRSVDWVTEAGAGGEIAQISESAQEEFDMDIKALTTEQLKQELSLREAAVGDEGGEQDGEGKASTTPASPPASADSKVEPTPKGGEAPTMAPDGFVSKTELPDLIAAGVESALKARDDAAKTSAEVKESAKAALKEEMAKSTLPKGVKDVISVRISESAGWGNGFTYTDEPGFRSAVQGELAQAQAMLAAAGRGPSSVKGLGATAPEGEQAAISEAERKLTSRWGDSDAPKKARTTWSPEDLEAETKGERRTEPVAEAGDDEGVTDRIGRQLAARMGI